MRKKLVLLLSFLLSGFFALQAQDYIPVSGYVTDENTGDPVAGQLVSIDADSAYASDVLTNEAGFYTDTVPVGNGLNFIYIYTLDNCSYLYHDTTINNPQPGVPVFADFEICDDTTASCQADFTYYADSTDPHLIYFVDLSTPSDSIFDWYWEFGDGTSSNEQNPSHQFGDAGTYQVCLSINNALGACMDTYCMDIVIGNPAGCQAAFSHAADSTDPYTINFFDQSTPPNQISSWSWNFGDGNTSGEQNPVHTYVDEGTYNVCLTITALSNEDSCISVYCDDIAIQVLPSYYMGGNTFAGIYQLDDGFAYAYHYENGAYNEVYSQVMDSLGYYLFNPFAGDYYVKAEPTPNSAYYNAFMPTYYGDAIHWEDAEMISLNQNLFNADINLVEMAVTIPGTGIISGHIFHQDDKRDDNPATDIQIMLANEAGDYAGIIFSDEEGYFEFDALPNGTYTLYAEVMGKSIVPKNFSLSGENQHVDDVVMVIGESNIVFGINEINSRFVDNISDIYPNPVSNTLNIDVEMKEASRLEFNIISLTGQYMQKRNFELYQSESIDLNTSSLKAGMYLLEIITEDDFKISKRFVKY
ncbi:MAG: PKD domain-containing protein [Bacteroidales bacterium]|nr:PKD domain-containing protein [Bacteroidales bacterium]MCF8386249.1 PKD domain-containing protein [Bacteroidales bacterium]MCF8397502.1 PKD domain-containing protein [Bacteroidales bacterium]